MHSDLPQWVHILAALLTPTLALLGSYIAYSQWRTAQNRLKLDLFEKRYAVYNAARDLLVFVLRTGRVTDYELRKFVIGTSAAKWLLDRIIADYLWEEVYKKASMLNCLEAELEGMPVGDQRTANVQRQSQIKDWLNAQYPILDQKFASFLHIKH